MTSPNDRMRRPPQQREAAPELELDLLAMVRALRDEPHPPTDGHRQISLVHRGHVRLVLFAFEAGGHVPRHRAPGLVIIHVLAGTLHVHTSVAVHEIGTGQLLVLDPGIEHEVEALEESDMLLAVHFDRAEEL
jgi:quercetin dioxygenase-like cupin family protein